MEICLLRVNFSLDFWLFTYIEIYPHLRYFWDQAKDLSIRAWTSIRGGSLSSLRISSVSWTNTRSSSSSSSCWLELFSPSVATNAPMTSSVSSYWAKSSFTRVSFIPNHVINHENKQEENGSIVHAVEIPNCKLCIGWHLYEVFNIHPIFAIQIYNINDSRYLPWSWWSKSQMATQSGCLSMTTTFRLSLWEFPVSCFIRKEAVSVQTLEAASLSRGSIPDHRWWDKREARSSHLRAWLW